MGVSLTDADQRKGDRSAWQDIEWAEFARTEDVKITCLSEGGRQHQIEQREIARQKGKQRAGDQLVAPELTCKKLIFVVHELKVAEA